MASPQTEQGYVMIAYDLHFAIAACDLPNGCQIVLAEALRSLYGASKAPHVLLKPADLAAALGIPRQNAWEAIRDLVTWKILARAPDVDEYAYVFNKDYETWVVRGEKLADRRGGKLLEHAKSLPFQAPQTPSDRNPTGLRPADPASPNGVTPVTQRGDAAAPAVTQRGDDRNPTGLRPVTQRGYAAIKERAPEDFKKDLKTRPAGAPACACEEDPDPPATPIPPATAEPPFPDLSDAEMERRSAAIRTILDAARLAFGQRGERWAGQFAHEYTERVSEVLAAIRDAKAQELAGTPIRSVGGWIKGKMADGAYGAASRPAAKPTAAPPAYKPPRYEASEPVDLHWESLTEHERALFVERERDRDRRSPKLVIVGRARDAAYAAAHPAPEARHAV